MSASLSNVLIGVTIAIVAFLAQQLAVFIFDGITFRRRITADIRLTIAGFRAWNRPSEVVIAQAVDNSRPVISMNLIWDYSYESMEDLYEHTAHLPAELFARIVRFYSATGRFDEIRQSYNEAIIETIKSSEKAKWATVLNCHLTDMGKVVQEITSSGEAILASLAKRYALDTAVQELAEKHSD